MAEGGQLPWKIQKITQFGPTADYSNLSKPLPNPPSGKEWERDDVTHEWRLVSTTTPPSSFSSSLEKNKEGEWESKREEALPLPNEKIDEKKKQDEQDKISLLASQGKSYIKHVILPTDTLSGLCLKYKISPVKLRQVNHFSGSSLTLAPNPLIIPLGEERARMLMDGRIKVQDVESREYKRGMMGAEFPSLRGSEMNAYLDMNNWDLEAAKQNVREDIEWEKSQKQQRDSESVSHQPIITSAFQEGTKKAKNVKKKMTNTTTTLTAHVAIPVSDSAMGGRKKKKKEGVEIELSSSFHGKSSMSSALPLSSPPPTKEKQNNNPMKELFRPLLPRRS